MPAKKSAPASKKIVLHLGKQNVKFDIVKHRKVYTAYDLAQTTRAKLESVAKTLLVKAELPGIKKLESKHYVVVLPASYNVDLGKLKKALGAKKIELVLEKGMKKMGLEPGALTPFGSVRGLGVVVDKAFLKAKDALMGAESFTEHLRMKVKDFMKAESPLTASFGKKNNVKLQVSLKLKKPAKKKVAAKKKPTAKKKVAAKKKRA